MDSIFLVGILGSTFLVIGSAWPDSQADDLPTRSVKNWLFATGGITMLLYAWLGYQYGNGSVFFVFFEILAVLASVLMMLTFSERLKTGILLVVGTLFLAWSLYLFDDYNIIYFVLGLLIVCLGYVFQMGSLRRSLALMIGSVFIALFSYLEASWIFFWMNTFFAVFSGYYAWKEVSVS